MHVKSILLDGFKSYSERTAIRGIDRRFTAITGANGSGKSNVVDALLFVLDLGTNKQLRVGSASELINTQRRECSVKVVFDNRTRPAIGYEHLAEIEVERTLDAEGKSKWRINGHACSRGSIESLRGAAGISENSVVLQGRITKILGMHRNELREMLEEAAGTKSYNAEKKRACEVLEKKEEKLREVKEWLKRTIEPYVTRLNEERVVYERQKNAAKGEERLREEIREVEKELAVAENSMKIKELEAVVEELDVCSRELKAIDKDSGDTEERNSFEDKAKLQRKIERLREEIEACDYIEDKRRLQALEKMQSNIKDNKEDTQSNKEELIERERILKAELYAEGDTRIEELEKMRRARTRAKLILDRSTGTSISYSEILNLFEESFSFVSSSLSLTKRLPEFMQTLKSGERDKATLERAKRELKEFIRIAEKEAETLQAKLTYTPGEGVYGAVDENYVLKDTRYEVAISVILGGKSKYIICDTDERAASVIQKSARKVSCIPLNKIVGGGNKRKHKCGTNALDVVEYDQKCKKAFEWLLGGILIFDNPKEAEVACFEERMICVSLDGVVYNPHGTLTGGATPAYSTIRVKGSDLRSIRKFIEVCYEGLQKISTYEAEYDKIEIEETARKEYTKATKSIKLLERLCNATVNVKEELKSVRSQINSIEEHERKAEEEREQREALNKKILTLRKEVTEKEQRREILTISLNELLEVLRAMDEREGKASDYLSSDLESKKRHLLAKVAKLTIYAKKLFLHINDTSEKENHGNLSDSIHRFLQTHITALPSFSQERVSELSERARTLRQDLKACSAEFKTSKIDSKRFELLDLHLEMMHDLESKISRLENDRIKITHTMERLSSLGAEANRHAFMSINKNIGKFFSYFVPHSDVTIDANYDICVKIGSWVNSTDELSGGQRSLIALSLIFSILAHNPASLYIFDEIDAALDMNYSQSIGEIIRHEFHSSQFIVISLKNNLFDNANKIFRVQLQDQKPIVFQIK